VDGVALGLTGGGGSSFNHAKIGVSKTGPHHYAIFGDKNQQGALSEKNTRQGHKCSSSRNGWRGLFYVIDDKPLSNAVKELIEEGTAH